MTYHGLLMRAHNIQTSNTHGTLNEGLRYFRFHFNLQLKNIDCLKCNA
jgi:hypothetical protein